MCFSATASFTTAAILIPAGIYCIKEAKQLEKPYWAFSMLPFLFGLQQLFEGGVWLALLEGNAINVRSYSLGFLMFSHIFWLGWIAYSSYLVERSPKIRNIFKLISIVGVVFGTSLFIPLLFNTEWLTVSIIKHSIHYNFIYYYDYYIPQSILTAFYSGAILVPLFLSSDRYHNILGVLIFISGLVTWAFFTLVFVSVWCYFSAVISLYIFYIITQCVNSSRVQTTV